MKKVFHNLHDETQLVLKNAFKDKWNKIDVEQMKYALKELSKLFIIVYKPNSKK